MINVVELEGPLTADVELVDTPSGSLRAEFTVAVKGLRWDRSVGTDVVDSVFVRVLAWEDVAATVGTLLKGTVVWVRGRLTQQETTDRDGRKDRKTKVTASVVQVVRTPPAARPAPVGDETYPGEF